MKAKILPVLLIVITITILASCKRAELPVVVTSEVTANTGSTAICGGDVTSEGGSHVKAKGICWSTVSPPTINNSLSVDGEGLGAYTSYLSHLNSASTYYVRAYATNSVGTAYGTEVSFRTY